MSVDFIIPILQPLQVFHFELFLNNNFDIECENIAIGNIMGGLILSEVGLVGYADSIMTQFYSQTTRTQQTQRDAINSELYQNAGKNKIINKTLPNY